MSKKKTGKWMIYGCLFVLLVIIFVFSLVVGAAAVGFMALNQNGMTTSGGTGEIIATTSCGTGVDTLVTGIDMLPAIKGKLGHEEHLSNTKPSHYCGSDSGNCSKVAGDGAYSPHTTEQERWYINSQWGGWDWSTTSQEYKDAHNGKTAEPIQIQTAAAKKARKAIQHARIIVTSTETGKSLVASVEESGPAMWVFQRDGISYGAPPEVYNYLGTSNPYTKNKNDGKGEISVSFASDQSVKIGPCK